MLGHHGRQCQQSVTALTTL